MIVRHISKPISYLEIQLLSGVTGGYITQDLLGESGLLKELTKRLAERVLEVEMEMHLGYAKHDPAGNNSGNSRNGKTSKSVRSQNGEIELDIPRDRNSTFEPVLIGKNEKQLNGFDDRIISLYSRGLSTRDIQAHFKEVYGVDVSSGFISQVTNAVMDEVKCWQQRPMDALYPIVYLDCIVVKSQDGGAVANKSVYLALGVNGQGEKELLGLWIAKTEGAKFWLSVMTELKNRGLQDIFIACCDGLKGFPDAIEAVYPHTRVQLCIVHQVRNSLRYVGWKERKAVAADLRTIYSSATLEGAEEALDVFAAKWDEQFPTISLSWRNNWERLIVIFDFPPEIRKVIYTTNAIESLNASLRKITKTRRIFPTDDAVIKLLYLALHNISAKWTLPIRDWKPAMSQFMLMYGDRISG